MASAAVAIIAAIDRQIFDLVVVFICAPFQVAIRLTCHE
jgi:hypothetical protein